VKRKSDIYYPTPLMESLINNFYRVFQCVGNATPTNRLIAEINGVEANIAIVRACMPHHSAETQATAEWTINNLRGVINDKQAAIDAMNKPKRRYKK